jgi:hypothetical protein
MTDVLISEVGDTFELILGFDELVYGDDDIEGNLDSILLNAVASNIP